MSTFSKTIFEGFKHLREEYAFVPAVAFKRFVSMVRYETDEVFIYVFAKDDRPTGSNLNVDVWIAPPESPDDTLDNLCIGYKIRVGSQYEADDSFLLNCEKRIVQIIKFVPAIVPVIREELAHPVFNTKRLAVYQLERKATRQLLLAAAAGNRDAIAVVEMAKKGAKKPNGCGALESVCVKLSESIMSSGSLGDDVVRFYKNKECLLASGLANQLHAMVLGELSLSRRIQFPTTP